MKKIIVSEIPEEGLEFDLSEKITSEEFSFESPLEGYIKIFKTGSEVVAQGAIRTSVRLECGRCLEGFALKLNSPVNSVFQPAKILTRDEHYELHEDELNTEFYSDDKIDLLGFLMQEVMLNVPMKPLCREDCKGICPICGAEMNKNPCQCSVKGAKNGFTILDKITGRKE